MSAKGKRAMKVLLINPPYSATERYGKDLGKFGPLNEPLGLAYLAANLERAGHQIEILDAPALGITSGKIPQIVKEHAYGLVGVTMLTPMYARSTEVVQRIKKALPETKIVVGGPHPTILPQETLLENEAIDYIVVGEGEMVLLELANCLETGDRIEAIKGLGYRSKGKVTVNPPPELITDLDILPIPARHLLPMNAYRMTKSRRQSDHAFTVSVARGCPFNCAFCCRIFGRKVRHHSVARLMEEIGTLMNKYGANEINLEADTLTLNKAFVHELCDELIHSGVSRRITWTCESRVDTVDEALLGKMRQAGCWQISYGVETGSQRLLDLIDKGITLDQIEKTFAITKKIGISIRAFYMLGLPTETREESLKTIAFAKKLDARWSQFTLCTPFPGTELYDLAIKEGGLQSNNWADFKTHGGWTEGGLAYVPKGRSLEEMKRLQKQAYRNVYLRPKVFFRFLRTMDSMSMFREYVMGFWVLVKTAFPGVGRRLRVQKIPREDLERCARGAYVDSPVYFSNNPLTRYIQWWKLDFALRFIPNGDQQKVLDFGCGNGVLFPSLASHFDSITGIDLHTSAAERLRQDYGLDQIRLVRTNGTELPFKEDSFHTILALSVLEHFETVEAAIEEIHRVMKPDGLLIFLSPSENFFYRFGRKLLGIQKPEDHYHTAEKIESMLRRRLSMDLRHDFPIRMLPFLSMYRLGVFRKTQRSSS
jgi:radical SAM superfamily enzyme YgiQ (UPF0313 family)